MTQIRLAQIKPAVADYDLMRFDSGAGKWVTGQLRSISVNDASAALTVTQAGAGASLSLPSATTAAKGLILVDVALYRSAANTLNTPDSLTIGGIVALSAGAVGAPSYTFTGDLDTGMWHWGADNLAFSTAGVQRLRITATGLFGIRMTPTIMPVAISGRVFGQDAWGQAGTFGLVYADDSGRILLSNASGTYTKGAGIGIHGDTYPGNSGGIDFATGDAVGAYYSFKVANVTKFRIFSDRSVFDNMMTFGQASEVTIAGGVITITRSYHRVDTEADDATDDLDTINGAIGGTWLVLQTQDAARDVTVRHGVGNIWVDGKANFTLTGRGDKFIAIYDSVLGYWCGFGLDLV